MSPGLFPLPSSAVHPLQDKGSSLGVLPTTLDLLQTSLSDKLCCWVLALPEISDYFHFRTFHC